MEVRKYSLRNIRIRIFNFWRFLNDVAKNSSIRSRIFFIRTRIFLAKKSLFWAVFGLF